MMSNDFDIYPDMHTGYGLATLINPEPTAEGRSGMSLAWAGLANTYYWADPAVGKAGLIMTQLLPFGDSDMLGLLKTLETASYGG
jgi:CubicO group peptidase (beta-lactamase class C family)